MNVIVPLQGCYSSMLPLFRPISLEMDMTDLVGLIRDDCELCTLAWPCALHAPRPGSSQPGVSQSGPAAPKEKSQGFWCSNSWAEAVSSLVPNSIEGASEIGHCDAPSGCVIVQHAVDAVPLDQVAKRLGGYRSDRGKQRSEAWLSFSRHLP